MSGILKWALNWQLIDITLFAYKRIPKPNPLKFFRKNNNKKKREQERERDQRKSKTIERSQSRKRKINFDDYKVF